MTKLLLTSVCRPFGGPGEGASVGAELFHAQVTRAQGPFSLRQVIRVWALDYLAENVETPTVTLHYPSRRELVRELRSGAYTHVGINFVVATFHKVRWMVEQVRRYLPRAKIIFGGYGTVLPDELLLPYADAICREEGVGFLRQVLGERDDAPIRAPHAPTPSVRVLSHQQPQVVGHITAGLGCPNGCDFCCTSHFFKRRYVRFLERGRDIYEAMMATRARARSDGFEMNSLALIDEDFFLHHKRAREFLDCCREGGQPLGIFGFGSVRGLSRFTAREIAEMGFDLVWNAFEGKEAGYKKQRGRSLPELYADLKSVGCAQMTSMIIGFPYQNEAQIRAEFEELMALDPAMVQCLIYFAFPGTPFHEQVLADGRYHQRYAEAPDLRRWDGFSMHFSHPHFDDPRDVERLQRELYDEDFRRLGPTPARLMRVWLTGYENLRGDDNPLLAARAERLRESVRGALPSLTAAALFAPSRAVRERAVALRRDAINITGEQTLTERVYEAASPALYLATLGAMRAGVLQQPGLLRTEHRMEGSSASQHTRHVMRLHRGLSSGLLPALAEEIGERARALAAKSPLALLARSLRRDADDATDFARQARVVTTRPCPLSPSMPAGAADSPDLEAQPLQTSRAAGATGSLASQLA